MILFYLYVRFNYRPLNKPLTQTILQPTYHDSYDCKQRAV